MESIPPFSQSELVYARLAKDLSSTTSTVAAAEVILKAADELIGWEASYLILYDPDQGGRPRPLLAIDTINNERVIEYNVVPEKPSENMLRAIQEDGFLSLYEDAFDIAPSLSFGDRQQRTLSQLFVPVRSGARTIGVLSIQSYRWHAYNEHSLETLKTLSSHCAGAMERIWAQEALIQLVERLKVMYEAAHAISASLDMEELCNVVYTTVEKVMSCDDFVIDGYDAQTNEIVPIYAIEFPHKRVETKKYVADHGMAGRIVHSQKSLLFNSIEQMDSSGIDFEFYGSNEEDKCESIQSILAVPMILHGKVAGMISTQSYKEDAYTKEDQYLLELLASHAAVAIENSRLFSTIQRLADTDPLTGMLTRRKFFELAELEFNRAKRYKQQLSIIILDVDEFKKFNDKFGHQVGDLVLKLVAAQCKSSLRDMDIIGRLGGEEFVVVLPGTEKEQAIQVATRLCNLVENANLSEAGSLFEMTTGETFDMSDLKVTVSVGVAMYDESCKNIDVLMDHADRAMYSVKHTGRNKINIWNNGE